MTRLEAEAVVRSQPILCKGPRDQRVQVFDANGVERSTVACGFDFAPEIAGVPFDSQEHQLTCPRCGTVLTYRAPWFPGVDGQPDNDPSEAIQPS